MTMHLQKASVEKAISLPPAPALTPTPTPAPSPAIPAVKLEGWFHPPGRIPCPLLSKTEESVVKEVIAIEQAKDPEATESALVHSTLSGLQHLTEWFEIGPLATIAVILSTVELHAYVLYCEDTNMKLTHYAMASDAATKILIANRIRKPRRVRIVWF